MEELKITHLYDRQPGLLHIKLEKNSRGYNWEISFAHEDEQVVLRKIRKVNARLTMEYGPGNTQTDASEERG